MPGIIGSTGWGRSTACIPDFSSTHSTTAFSGDLWYTPTTATTFSMNSESGDSLNPSARCGLRSNFRQILPIVEGYRPLRLAIDAPRLGRVPWIFQAGSCRSVQCLIA
jgi:hypothetical protein